MAEHGGYRKPANPAAVSGPGAHSQRTDGQPKLDLPNAQYGENAAFQEAQSGAPLARSAQGPASSGTPGLDLSGIVGMGAPSTQPDTPVTDGAEYGDGAGADALGIEDPNVMDAKFLAKYLPAFIDIAESDATPPGFKTWVRNIIANQ